MAQDSPEVNVLPDDIRRAFDSLEASIDRRNRQDEDLYRAVADLVEAATRTLSKIHEAECGEDGQHVSLCLDLREALYRVRDAAAR